MLNHIIFGVPQALLFACLLMSGTATLSAQDSQDPSEAAAAEKPDRFAVPEGGVEQLIQFISELGSFRPTTIEEYTQYRAKAPQAIEDAALKIQQLERDPTSKAYQLASSILLSAKAGRITEAQPEQQQKILDELLAYVAGRDTLSDSDVRLAMKVCQTLEMAAVDQLAGQAYEKFGAIISKSDNPRYEPIGKQLSASARRLNLVGNEMLVKGTTVEGEPFDLMDWKGKVVLVDFWATWCGPCVAEMPNIKKLYDEYHAQGFEVVGISLDQNRRELEAFLEAREVPWTILHEGGPDGHPAANYYGVMAIPAMFLVGKDGHVLSISARGPELEEMLKEQFDSAP